MDEILFKLVDHSDSFILLFTIGQLFIDENFKIEHFPCKKQSCWQEDDRLSYAEDSSVQ